MKGKVSALVAAGILFWALSVARALGAYTDRNKYFTFEPPDGWEVNELVMGYRSELLMQPPDRTVTAAIIAELNDDNLGNLYLLKKDFVRGLKERFPQGDFGLSRVAIAGFGALRIDYELPGVTHSELYIFFYDGVRFDLVLSAANPQDLARHRRTALAAFSSLRPLSRTGRR